MVLLSVPDSDFLCMTSTTPYVIEPQRFRDSAKRSAAVGVVAWALFMFIPTSDSRETELVHRIVFFAVLVIVPLGFSLVATTAHSSSSRLFVVAVTLRPLAALCTITSFLFGKGLVSALLAAAWLIPCGAAALFGLKRLLSRGIYPLHETSIDAGLLYLPVAAAWLVVYRLGMQPFDYGEMIILLTVVHFHFAGFAAPIIAGMAGRRLAENEHGAGKMFPLIVLLLVGAMPLVAAGITFSPWLGLLGTLVIATGLLLLAVLTVFKVLPVVRATGTRVLLSIAALSSCVAMVLACLYAYSLVAHILILRIPTMAMTHGLLNAFGFATCSLFAWSKITQTSPVSNPPPQPQAVAQTR